MTTIKTADRSLPVEVSLKYPSTGNISKIELTDMDAFDVWYNDKMHKITGSLADASMTMINAEAIEEAPARKAKAPTKKVLAKAEEVKKERAAQEKRDAKDKKRRIAGKPPAKAKAKKEETKKASETAKKEKPKGNGPVRTGVKATGPNMKDKEFAPLAKSYDTFRLPYDSGFQKLRKEIKASGKGEFKHEKHGNFKLVGFVKE